MLSEKDAVRPQAFVDRVTSTLGTNMLDGTSLTTVRKSLESRAATFTSDTRNSAHVHLRAAAESYGPRRQETPSNITIKSSAKSVREAVVSAENKLKRTSAWNSVSKPKIIRVVPKGRFYFVTFLIKKQAL